MDGITDSTDATSWYPRRPGWSPQNHPSPQSLGSGRTLEPQHTQSYRAASILLIKITRSPQSIILLLSKITADGDYSHEIKSLILGRKAVSNLDSILKSRDITLPTVVHIFKAMVFPIVVYGCESWTVKKAEHQRINAFELWCWRRLLRVPCCKEIKPVNPKGNQP